MLSSDGDVGPHQKHNAASVLGALHSARSGVYDGAVRSAKQPAAVLGRMKFTEGGGLRKIWVKKTKSYSSQG